jgi:hypothetical protein
MGAGILPVAEYNGNIVFLFGQEYSDKKWSDFGGTRNKHESNFDNAIREGYEETDGFFGTKTETKKLINNNAIIRLDTKNGYHTYLFKIAYDSHLPLYFNNHHKFIDKNFPSKVNREGFFEKSKMRWFSYNDIVKEQHKFRSFYKEIIKIILKNYKQVKDLILNKKIK